MPATAAQPSSSAFAVVSSKQLQDDNDASLRSLHESLLSHSGESISDDAERGTMGLTASPHAEGHSSLLSSTLTLSVSAAGAGLLSFAYAVRAQGIIAAVLSTLAFALLNGATLRGLCRTLRAYEGQMVGKSYEELVGHVLGPRWYNFALFTILFGGLGAMTGYLIIQLSLAHQVLWALCTHTDSVTGVFVNHCGFLSSRSFIALILCSCVIFPLSFCRSLHDLAASTVLSMATVCSVMAIVVGRALQALLTTDDSGSSYPHSADQAALHTPSGWLLNAEPRFFLAWPIIIFSLGCSLQVPHVYLELSPALRGAAAVERRVIPSMTIAVCVLYLLTGIFGFVLFGSGVDGDVLLSFSPDDHWATVAKALMTVHVALAFPVLLCPSRAAIDLLLLRSSYALQPSRRNSVLQALVLITLAALLAVLIPQVQTVFGLLGATISVSQMYLMPGLMLLALPNTAAALNRWDWDHRLGYALCAASVVMGVLGTTSTILDM